MKQGTILFSYPNVACFFNGSPKVGHFRVIIDTVLSKFSTWHDKTFSLVSHVCLVNSVITSMLMHVFMIYKWHKSILKVFSRAIINFIWIGNIGVPKKINVP